MLFVQKRTADADDDMRAMTVKLIDRTLAIGGSYYLPYRLHATREQMRAAYPRLDEFIAAKRRYDPQLRFRNALWDTLSRVTAGSDAFRSVGRRRSSVCFFLQAPTWSSAPGRAAARSHWRRSCRCSRRPAEDARATAEPPRTCPAVGALAFPARSGTTVPCCRDAEKSAADFALAGRQGAGRSERQAEHNDERRHGAGDQMSFHEILPMLWTVHVAIFG